ncbi:MAG: sulfite exporter TauE/SafE family protein [Campylobacter sp.]|nr:sulfite exporter TauE/SafE family protein [Campylobacter sp.]
MKIATQTIDWLDPNLSYDNGGATLFENNTLRIQINDELENALNELQELKDKLSSGDSAKLLELCKENAINTITSQFGLASLVISAKDGGSVTTTHNFKKGIVANDEDRKKYETWKGNQNKDWGDLRKETGYDDPLPTMRKKAFKKDEKIISAYTGKELPKDGQAHLDHIVSAHEIENNPSLNLYMTPEQRAKIATSKENLAWSEGSINQSKGKQKMRDFLDKKRKDGTTNKEYFSIDENLAKQVDKEARKFVNMEKFKAQVKKDGKELAITGGKDAGKMAVYSAFALILKEFIEGAIIEIKATLKNFGDESWKKIKERFKNRLSAIWENLKTRWKDIISGSIEGAITAFFSNLLVFAINLVATTLKKIVSIIRAGFVSLAQAIKMIVNPPENIDKDDVYYEAFKILVAGLIGGASLGLSAGIDSLLASVPGLNALMALPLPFSEHGTVGSALSVTITALLGGILTTIAIYYMDKFRSNSKKSKLKFQLMTKSGEVVQLRIAQSWFVLSDGYKTLITSATQTAELLQTVDIKTNKDMLEIDKAIRDDFAQINNMRTNLKNKLKNLKGE